eukprot:TRINITY_DN1099_c0_g1_i4.p1 TRINITY_DN1099_c0_g1~~TRINITY_DN1099_c0_g1_i4.p1  ORF type:complete len:184 (-),score=36.48 TRINITY_DN1099_c0_g1_i4:244-795(-)
MRKLKFHERKLLKKVNFYQWKQENNAREIEVMRRYHVQKRDDYRKYHKLAGKITQLVSELIKLPPNDEYRIKTTDQLLNKLFDMGLIKKKSSLSDCRKIGPSAFCRRRFAVILVRNKFVENLKAATTFIEQGHLRIGTEVVTTPEFLVTRNMEEFITWVDSSKIKRKILKYNDQLDDYDLLQC